MPDSTSNFFGAPERFPDRPRRGHVAARLMFLVAVTAAMGVAGYLLLRG